MRKRQQHTFHIPVMGTAFTIDTPIKNARFGITSVISIGDDELCENMREFYAGLYKLDYAPIDKQSDVDYRAKRICAYLNLVKEIVDKQVATMKSQEFGKGFEIDKYFEMLPDSSPIRARYEEMLGTENNSQKASIQDELRTQIIPGEIEVNVMTKIDRINYDKDKNELGPEYSDASCVLRGFATSNLSSSIVFSAGFNRRLYAYIEEFDDFFPDENNVIKKKVTMKVSDVRSSLTQGKFLAKKGIWISEHRIESGLNCGGHAFASDGYLLGPIMEEFKSRRNELQETFLKTCNDALAKKGRQTFSKAPDTLITVQGGIGSYNEDQFLLDEFEVDGTGWATPFLLVPEATTIDMHTRKQLESAGEDDLYLSDLSPLGIPFNTIRNTDSEKQKMARVADGRPGSPCPKGHLVSNTEFTKKPVCTAAFTYQKRKIEQLENQKEELSEKVYQEKYNYIIAKACLCEDLAAGALIDNDMDNNRPLKSAVCPGPNLAYFSKITSLKNMVDHIYGRQNLLNDTPRSNMFISELKMYIDYLKKEIIKALPSPSEKDLEYFTLFKQNLDDGISYYKRMIPKLTIETESYRDKMKDELLAISNDLEEVFKPNYFGQNVALIT